MFKVDGKIYFLTLVGEGFKHLRGKETELELTEVSQIFLPEIETSGSA